MLIAKAESAAVDAKIVMATCSLMSVTRGKACKQRLESGRHTEGPGVQEAPETGIRRLEAIAFVSGSRNNLLKDSTKNVGDDLNEELADEDGLGAEILRKEQNSTANPRKIKA